MHKVVDLVKKTRFFIQRLERHLNPNHPSAPNDFRATQQDREFGTLNVELYQIHIWDSGFLHNVRQRPYRTLNNFPTAHIRSLEFLRLFIYRKERSCRIKISDIEVGSTAPIAQCRLHYSEPRFSKCPPEIARVVRLWLYH